MSIFTKTILALALTGAAVLPAAAEGMIDGTYNKETRERYMPNARPTAPQNIQNRGTQVAPQFFLQQRRGNTPAAPRAKYEPNAG